jgi:hypothetical protein
MITKFTPGHDFPLRSTVAPDLPEDVTVELYFSEEMNCDLVTDAITFNSSSGKSWPGVNLVIMGRADLCLFLGTYARNSYAFI